MPWMMCVKMAIQCIHKRIVKHRQLRVHSLVTKARDTKTVQQATSCNQECNVLPVKRVMMVDPEQRDADNYLFAQNVHCTHHVRKYNVTG